jgi:uncharacterized membrane protein YccC
MRPQRSGEKLVGLIGRALRGQKISDDHLYAGVEDFVQMFSRAPDDPPHNPIEAARARAQDFLRRANAQQGHRQAPPRPPPRKPTGPDPRVTLGFAAGQKVTVAEVKARHRDLARRHHPDKGGDVRRMAAVNDAVKQLLSELRTT